MVFSTFHLFWFSIYSTPRQIIFSAHKIYFQYLIEFSNSHIFLGTIYGKTVFIMELWAFLLHNRDCPPELREAIASIIFAAPRCSDIPDLLHIKNLFTTKYGKDFISAVSELRPDSGVNRTVSYL